jgi:hypothetical protein
MREAWVTRLIRPRPHDKADARVVIWTTTDRGALVLHADDVLDL